MEEIKPTWGEELYKKWLIEKGWQEYTDVADIKGKHCAFVDVRGDETYQNAVDIDFELSEDQERAVIDSSGHPWRNKQTGDPWTWKLPIPHSVDIKDSPSAYNCYPDSDNKGFWLNIQVEKINDKALYDTGEVYDPVTFREFTYQIRKGVGWWIKNKDFYADQYIWFLPIFGEDGTGQNTTEKRHRATQKEFENWRDEDGRLDTDRFITELPTGIVLFTKRNLLKKLIKKYPKEYQHYKDRKTYISYDIPVKALEDEVLNVNGWSRSLLPAWPIVRYLTKNDAWASKRYPDKEHFSGVEIPVYEKYRYYVPDRLLREVYDIDTTQLAGIEITENGTIIIPPESEEYPDDAKPIANRKNMYRKDGSLRKLTRITMMGIQAWPEAGTQSQPKSKSQQEDMAEPF